MSFKIAFVSEPSPGCFICERSQPIRMGGPNGVIARHVLGLGRNETGWILEAGVLARALRPAGWPLHPDGWILWETPEAPPARLSRVLGTSTEVSTEIILELEPLEPAEGGALRPCGRLTGEALGLNGGRCTPAAKWTWAPPKMAIGSATILPTWNRR